MIQLRPYQREGVDALYAYWADGGGNPLLVYPTGAGKSLVAATIIKELTEKYPGLRVACVTHSRELILQNFQELLRLWPGAPAGVYSAGLNRRDTRTSILFCGIQSVWNKTAEVGAFDVILIDEAHLISRDSTTRYGQFLAEQREARPDARLVGLTATPYRLDSGRLDDGTGALFDRVIYEAGVGDLIDAGYLSPLISKRMAAEVNVTGLAKRAGDFVAGALEGAAMNVVVPAVEELVRYGADRRAWIVFSSGVRHSLEIRDEIRKHGYSCEAISGDTPAGQRDAMINEFRAGRLRCLTSVGVLSTGFNVPHVDLVGLMRPTLSTGLFVQQVGRGFRTAPGKADCLVLDFAGNCRRHGPVDQIEVETKRKKLAKEDVQVKPETVRAKECPVCESMAGLAARVCKTCGHEWPPVVEHDAEADDAPILSREAPKIEPNDQPVLSWTARAHEKFGAPPSLCVEYLAGLLTVREWLAFEHGGYPRHKAGEWWSRHGGASPTPTTVADAIVRFGELTKPSHIITRKNGKWHDIVGRRFDAGQQEQAA